jgi:hypothetical protein
MTSTVKSTAADDNLCANRPDQSDTEDGATVVQDPNERPGGYGEWCRTPDVGRDVVMLTMVE